MRMKWIAILLALYMFLMGGCTTMKMGMHTGEVRLTASASNTANVEIFSHTTTFAAIDSDTTVMPWAILDDWADGAINTVKHVGGLIGLLP